MYVPIPYKTEIKKKSVTLNNKCYLGAHGALRRETRRIHQPDDQRNQAYQRV